MFFIFTFSMVFICGKTANHILWRIVQYSPIDDLKSILITWKCYKNIWVPYTSTFDYFNFTTKIEISFRRNVLLCFVRLFVRKFWVFFFFFRNSYKSSLSIGFLKRTPLLTNVFVCLDSFWFMTTAHHNNSLTCCCLWQLRSEWTVKFTLKNWLNRFYILQSAC